MIEVKHIVVSPTVALSITFLAPWIIMGAIFLGYVTAWRFQPPPDPAAVDEVRMQMGKLREEMIGTTIDGIDVSDCKQRRWEMNAEFVPFIIVIGEQCDQKNKRKGKG